MARFLPAIQGLAIGTSFCSAGVFGVLTFITTPSSLSAIQTDHKLAARQFTLPYCVGQLTLAPSTLLSACFYGYMAFHSYHMQRLSGPWRIWAASSALTAAIIPWTTFLMNANVVDVFKFGYGGDKLPTESGHVAENDETEKSRLFEIMEKWSERNLARGVLAALSGSLGLWATLR